MKRCDQCLTEDETVRERVCAYEKAVMDIEATELVCDPCEERHIKEAEADREKS